jgi:hypothetical protein
MVATQKIGLIYLRFTMCVGLHFNLFLKYAPKSKESNSSKFLSKLFPNSHFKRDKNMAFDIWIFNLKHI